MALSSVAKRINNFGLRQKRTVSTLPAYITNTAYTKITTLPSGLRVVTADGTGDVSNVGLWINVGSARETDSNSGINNFLHKVILSGGSKSKLDYEIESIGANLSGYADRETTAIYGQTHSNDVSNFVSLLGDLISVQQLQTETIEQVREGILNVHRKLRNTWDENILQDYAHAAAYQGTSYASAAVGEPEVIKNITAGKLVEFHKQYYNAKDLVLVGTGAVKHDQFVNLASKVFSKLSVNGNPAFSRVNYVGSEIRIRDDTVHDVRISVNWEAVGRSHPHYWTSLLLQTIVGKWDRHSSFSGNFESSRWGEAISMNKAANRFSSKYLPYTNTGLFTIFVETSRESQEEVVYILFNEFQRLATYMTEEEMERAKNQLKVALLSHLENPENYAKLIGESVLSTYRPPSIAEYFQRIDQISIADIQDLISTFFTDVDPVLIAHGPIEEFPDYNIVRGWTYWNRW
jgi:processing peptidase subunit beta